MKAEYTWGPGPIIRFMHDKIKDLGGDLHAGNIRCMKCDASQGGGLHPDYGIMLCANRPEPLEDTLAHGKTYLAQMQVRKGKD